MNEMLFQYCVVELMFIRLIFVIWDVRLMTGLFYEHDKNNQLFFVGLFNIEHSLKWKIVWLKVNTPKLDPRVNIAL